MLTLISKYLGPMMKRTAGFFIAMMLVAALSMILLFGAVSAYRCYDASVDEFFSNYGYPDARIHTDMTEDADFDFVSSVEGVTKAEVRSYWVNSFKADTRMLAMKLTAIGDDGIIKLYDIDTAPESHEYPNIYLERYMAENNGVEAGDVIKIRFDDTYYDFYVEKIIQSCETINFQINNLVAGDFKDLGCAYIDESEADRFLKQEGFEDQIGKSNEVLISISEEYDHQAVLDEVVDRMPEDIEVSFAEVKDNEQNIQLIHNLLNGIKKVSVLLPLIFYIIMLVVVLLFMMQVIRNNFKEIGILMMLGYNKGEIVAMFSVCALISSLISVGIGIFCGSFLLEYIVGIFLDVQTVPYIYSELDIFALVISSVATIAIMQIACLISMLQLKDITPASIFQDDFGKHSVRAHGRLLSVLPADIQIAAGSIKQNPRRAVVSIFAIFAAFVMVFLGLIINQGVNTNIEQIENERLFYDAQITILNDADYEASEYIRDELLKQDFITAVDQVAVTTADISKGDFSDEYPITAMKTENSLVKIPDEKNEGYLSVPSRGIVIVEDLAELAGAEVGDTINIDGKKIEVKGVSAQYSGKSQFMSFAQLRDLGIDYYLAYFVNTTDEEALLEWLDEQEVVTYTIFTSNLKEKIKSACSSYISLTKMEILFAIAIAFMVITVMTVSSFIEQKRRLSILRVLGFQVSRVSRIWLLQVVVYFIPAILLAIPASTDLGKWFMIILSGKTLTYPYVKDPVIYLATLILVVLMYAASHFVSMITLRRQNLAESIKSRE